MIACVDCRLHLTVHSQPHGVIFVRVRDATGWTSAPICGVCYALRHARFDPSAHASRPTRVLWAALLTDVNP